jgi:hypothetical protein
MSSSNSIASLERTSLNVYEAGIFNCSRHACRLMHAAAAAGKGYWSRLSRAGYLGVRLPACPSAFVKFGR